MPTRPSKSKWTKYSVAADWWMLASGLMNLLSRLWPLAYQKLTLRAIKVGKNAGDPELTQDFDWHNVEGKRCQFIGRSLGERLTQSLIITCIIFEPLRFHTKWWLRRSSIIGRVRNQQRGRPPPLCSLVWVHTAPVTSFWQYLSFLLSGRAPRLKLLWSRRYNSFEEWATNEPDGLAKLRNGVGTAVAWLFIRFVQGVMAMPWIWAALVDTRRSLEDRRSVRDQIWHMAEELKDVWFTLELLGSMTRPADLMGKLFCKGSTCGHGR